MSKKKPTDMGTNQTGTGSAPIQAPRTAAGAKQGGATTRGDFMSAHSHVVQQYQTDGEPLGTMPPPTHLKGMVTAATDVFTGKKTSVFLDKLGERMAYERTGVRLYDLLLTKLHFQPSWSNGPTRSEVLEIRNEEHQHFRMLADTLSELGADPTVLTPSADVSAVEALGIHNVIADPRTTIAQSLDALLMVELGDNAGWELLIELAEGLGYTELASRFRVALDAEKRHLSKVKTWTRTGLRQESGASVVPPTK